jgi:hypothetical protein
MNRRGKEEIIGREIEENKYWKSLNIFQISKHLSGY